ncbi:MAG: MBOAT family protein [Deltaproteobacteria bacterium]|nr:MBOAT family protein [Deltaproteobacteria bacterium]
MVFTSYSYLYFLLLVIVLRWSAPRRAVPAVLLAAGAFFLWTFGWLGTALLGGAATAAFAAGRWLDRRPDLRRPLLVAAVVLLVGNLALFKYADFLVRQLLAVGSWAGLPNLLPLPGLVAPVAISFFTFQLVAYVVDVARGRFPAERDFVRFLAYATFFPSVVSGPIVRPAELLPQLARPPRFDAERFSEGVFVFLGGAFKKLVLADALAPAVQAVFDGTGPLTASAAWIGSFAFTAQLYCDFSGYTDLARGAAGMLGFELPPNFRLPYLAASIADFWRRWHISLSFWLRDYLYIPLGGSRRGRLRTYLNLLATMALAGLWHGAAWTMVVWGLLHGALLVLHRAFRDAAAGHAGLDRVRASRPWKVGGVLLTLLCVNLAWVFFRAGSLPAAGRVLRAMFAGSASTAGLAGFRTALILLALIAVGHALVARDAPLRAYRALSPALRGLVWAVLIVALFWFAAAPAGFLYVMF